MPDMIDMWSAVIAEWPDLKVEYRENPLPVPYDHAITELVRAYRQAGSKDRQALQDAVQASRPHPLLVYAERMASLAVQQHDRDRVLDGLLALAISGPMPDPHDPLFGAAMLYHSAGRLGEDAQLLFDAAAALAAPSAAHTLLTFTRERAPGNRTLKAFGYREVEDAGQGLLYWKRD